METSITFKTIKEGTNYLLNEGDLWTCWGKRLTFNGEAFKFGDYDLNLAFLTNFEFYTTAPKCMVKNES